MAIFAIIKVSKDKSSVTCVKFLDESHIITASLDLMLQIWKVVKKGAVNLEQENKTSCSRPSVALNYELKFKRIIILTHIFSYNSNRMQGQFIFTILKGRTTSGSGRVSTTCLPIVTIVTAVRNLSRWTGKKAYLTCSSIDFQQNSTHLTVGGMSNFSYKCTFNDSLDDKKICFKYFFLMYKYSDPKCKYSDLKHKYSDLKYNYKLFWNGQKTAQIGVGIFIRESLAQSVLEETRISSRLMLIKLRMGKQILIVFSAYASQTGESEDAKNDFWNTLSDAVRKTPSSEIPLVCGDLNGHVGEKTNGFHGVYGGFGYRSQNEDCVQILEFAEKAMNSPC
ncbi:hypothetical protein HELRODRAFT_164197 [Helobdella robusta]|uniref:Endonuclease/exonuclease/phosphatase domain-containing protein n=1 Tax=Helobdella robusta TaxID=6412 RepID=T1EV31_HELRO|nr:hypothetical protein HELRODRAFT_164197 [Helobdella robusta]ESN94366.1 hypothetical protein HELRODRAFT_164197 [Helobdella robusta]